MAINHNRGIIIVQDFRNTQVNKMQIAPKNYHGGITEEHVIHLEQPPQVIVIGNNSGTGLFCLAVRGENYGKIYFGIIK
jgi:hypothetical protein